MVVDFLVVGYRCDVFCLFIIKINYMAKKLKANVKLEDMDQDMAKKILIGSIEQNEKQLCVFLIQREIEGESEKNTAEINSIKAYIDAQNKVLINKFQ